MKLLSAGILLYRYHDAVLEVLLVHPGGPYWVNKDLGAWSIPKGLLEGNENPLDAARREFEEETGFAIAGEFIDLGKLKQPSGKTVHAFAVEGDISSRDIKSNLFELEWPRHSGEIQTFPEVDEGEWFDLKTAGMKIASGQKPFLDRLVEAIGVSHKSD